VIYCNTSIVIDPENPEAKLEQAQHMAAISPSWIRSFVIEMPLRQGL